MNQLIGCWISDPDFPREREKACMEFTENGKLIYTIIGEKSDQMIFLTYRVENNVLITDQPSHPKEERTLFYFMSDGKLVLIHDDMSMYVSVK